MSFLFGGLFMSFGLYLTGHLKSSERTGELLALLFGLSVGALFMAVFTAYTITSGATHTVGSTTYICAEIVDE